MEYPSGFLSSMEEMLKSEYPAFLSALSMPPRASLRINPLRDTALPFTDAVPWEPLGRYVPEGFKPGRDVRHFAGAFYMQEASAMAPAAVLRAHPGERVLDLCAAPGGKSGQLAAQMGGSGLLIANEPVPSRAQALSGNLERLGVPNAVVTCAQPDVLASRFPGFFDAILVDAPCSGEGMFRREEAARREWSENSPSGCAERQKGILRAAVRMLAPGGRIAYSTCTFNSLENEGVFLSMLDAHPNLRPADFTLPGAGASDRGMLRLWPHRVPGEGHFVAMAEDAGTPVGHAESANPPPDILIPDVLARWPERFANLRIERHGDVLYAVPGDCPGLDGIRILRRGLHLLRFGKGYIEPDHALAMAIDPSCAARRADLSETDAQQFLRGQALPGDFAPGWTLVTSMDLPLGWGKSSGGILKNHIPKGLRFS